MSVPPRLLKLMGLAIYLIYPTRVSTDLTLLYCSNNKLSRRTSYYEFPEDPYVVRHTCHHLKLTIRKDKRIKGIDNLLIEGYIKDVSVFQHWFLPK